MLCARSPDGLCRGRSGTRVFSALSTLTASVGFPHTEGVHDRDQVASALRLAWQLLWPVAQRIYSQVSAVSVICDSLLRLAVLPLALEAPSGSW